MVHNWPEYRETMIMTEFFIMYYNGVHHKAKKYKQFFCLHWDIVRTSNGVKILSFFDVDYEFTGTQTPKYR